MTLRIHKHPSGPGSAESLLAPDKSALGLAGYLLLLVVLLACARNADAQDSIVVEVQAGDVGALIQAVELANVTEGGVEVFITPNPEGDNEFVFESAFGGSDGALPDLTGTLHIELHPDVKENVKFRAADNTLWRFRFISVTGSGFLKLRGSKRTDQSGVEINDLIELSGFGALEGSGGAILLQDMAHGSFDNVRFKQNLAGENGGAIGAQGDSFVFTINCEFIQNSISDEGKGAAISIEGNAYGTVFGCRFFRSESPSDGCDIYVNSSGVHPINNSTLKIWHSVFSGLQDACNGALLANPNGSVGARNNTFSHGGSAVFGVTANSTVLGNLFDTQGQQQQQQAVSSTHAGTEAVCEGSNLQSLGYNISPDNSCGLDHPTDLPNTDPMVVLNEDGIPIPQAGSPAIDGGAVEAMALGDDDLASLPCDYVDILGTASPQDGNGDGIFECDIGAVEIAGAGDVTDGHSAAFFNVNRDGEGTYVEILNDTTAVVYTFTYRPDGSGPAWFIGVGRIEGNSIIIDELLRPIGTSFGPGFDPADIELTPIGGMSMVFPDCAAANPGGNVAYSGDVELGYEGLITRAARLSHINGCGGETPSAKAGLSGSFFDPARDGEGIIVEWLTSGQVLVVFFTYDQNGNQMWLIGIGTPNGNMVTMEALYASTYTSWGSAFDSSEVTISNWGTFTLTWTGCNAVTFDYDSTVKGFGSASRNYVRLSTLQNTSCPKF